MSKPTLAIIAFIEFIIATALTVAITVTVVKYNVPVFSIGVLMMSLLPVVIYSMCARTIQLYNQSH